MPPSSPSRSRAFKLQEDAKEVASHLERVMRAEIRPWTEFFSSLALPNNNREQVQHRVLINLFYYRVNYCAIAGIVWLAFSLWRPALVLVVGATASAAFVLFLTLRKPIFVQSKVVTQREKVLALAFFSLVLQVATGTFSALLLALVVTGALVAGHALLRPKSIRSKFSNFGVGNGSSTGVRAILEEDAASMKVLAMEGGNLDEFGNIGQGSRRGDVALTGERNERMNQVYARRRDHAKQREDMVQGAVAQFYFQQQGLPGQQHAQTEDQQPYAFQQPTLKQNASTESNPALAYGAAGRMRSVSSPGISASAFAKLQQQPAVIGTVLASKVAAVHSYVPALGGGGGAPLSRPSASSHGGKRD